MGTTNAEKIVDYAKYDTNGCVIKIKPQSG